MGAIDDRLAKKRAESVLRHLVASDPWLSFEKVLGLTSEMGHYEIRESSDDDDDPFKDFALPLTPEQKEGLKRGKWLRLHADDNFTKYFFDYDSDASEETKRDLVKRVASHLSDVHDVLSGADLLDENGIPIGTAAKVLYYLVYMHEVEIDELRKAVKRVIPPRIYSYQASSGESSLLVSLLVDAQPSVITLLVENGWLAAVDLCSIDQTSRGLRVCDSIWEKLCFQEWDVSLIPEIIIKQSGGYRGWYRLRSAKNELTNVHMQPINSDLYNHDIVFLFDVTLGGKRVLSKTLRCSTAVRYLQRSGGFTFLLRDHAIVLGKSFCLVTGKECTCGAGCRYGAKYKQDISVQMQILRPNGLCTLIRSGQQLYRIPHGDHGNINIEATKNAFGCHQYKRKDESKSAVKVLCSKAGEALSFQSSTIEALEIQKRLCGKQVYVTCEPIVHLVGSGEDFGITHLSVRLWIDSDRENFTSKIPKDIGVSVLNIFEQANGTECHLSVENFCHVGF